MDVDDDFVEEPAVASRSLAFLYAAGELGAEGSPPLANRLLGHRYTTFGQEIFDIPEAQGEPMVKPYRSRDDVGRETVSAIAWIVSHGLIVEHRRLT